MTFELELSFWSGETVRQHFGELGNEFVDHLINRPEIRKVSVLKHE